MRVWWLAANGIGVADNQPVKLVVTSGRVAAHSDRPGPFTDRKHLRLTLEEQGRVIWSRRVTVAAVEPAMGDATQTQYRWLETCTLPSRVPHAS